MPRWYAVVDVYAREMFEYEDIHAETEDEAREIALNRALRDSNLGAEDGDVSEIGQYEEEEDDDEQHRS